MVSLARLECGGSTLSMPIVIAMAATCTQPIVSPTHYDATFKGNLQLAKAVSCLMLTVEIVDIKFAESVYAKLL